MNELKNDKNLRQAVSRREQKLPPMPDDLNERLMQRLEEPETAPVAKQRPLWLYAAIAVAASILLLIIFNFGQEQAPQEPVVAQNVEHPVSTVGEPAEPPVPEPVEGEPVKGSAPKPSQQPTKKQRKVVMQLVELIPTSEAKSENVKKLPASLIDKVKAYDQASDPSRTTGIDDGTDAIVTSTTVSDAPDPLVTMTAQVEDIRQRGKRLEREIELRIEELKN